MGQRFPSVQTSTILNATVLTTTETVICTSPPFTPTFDNPVIWLFGFLQCLIGTGTTSVNWRIRLGTTITGTLLVGGVAETEIAGNTVKRTLIAIHSPGPVSGQQYSITVQQNAATGNATVNEANLNVFAL